MGIGYYFYDVRPKLLLVFKKRKTLLEGWNKVIKWWPDDLIRIRFLETNDSFEFILYCETDILTTKWVFYKALNRSDNYAKFKDDYDGAAILGLALYKPRDESYELEIFDYKKRVTDIVFTTEKENKDSVVVRTIEVFRKI